MPSRRPYKRWTASEKERLITLRRQNPDMSYTELANTYFADRDPRALRKAFNAHAKKTRDEEKARASRDNVTPRATSMTTTGTSSKSPERVTSVETRDDENSSSDEHIIEDIYFSGEWSPNKRVKLTYSTRSQAASGNLQRPQDSAIIQSESSERPKSLDRSTLTLSPRLGRGNIVPFSEHANRNLDLGVAEKNNNENHDLPHCTPPPPPPSIPPPSTPPPPPEEAREEEEEEEEAQNQTPVVAAVDHSTIRQSETQDQVGKYTPKQDRFSAAVFKKEIAQQTAKTHQSIERLLTVMEENETKILDQEKKLKQYESMETDKDSQISLLQTERKQLISENTELKNKLRNIYEYIGRTGDLSTIAGA